MASRSHQNCQHSHFDGGRRQLAYLLAERCHSFDIRFLAWLGLKDPIFGVATDVDARAGGLICPGNDGPSSGVPSTVPYLADTASRTRLEYLCECFVEDLRLLAFGIRSIRHSLGRRQVCLQS